MSIPYHNTYHDLGDQFYERIAPTPVASPELLAFNHELAAEIGLQQIAEPELALIFSGNQLLDNTDPIAMAYNGHQFGHFNPNLGDGRAILLGQLVSPHGEQIDLQLKGSGRTRYSRGGDGRSALGPVIREYLLSEAMHRLGVASTRALAAVTTGEDVYRDSIKPGGIITRVSRSFIRVGTFQYFAHRDDTQGLRKLADYTIHYLYPELDNSDDKYADLLSAVVSRQANLISQWMNLGFIHGVMNTDNMSIAGETIDYGPCAFMDHFAHERVYSSIDHHGRYAYNQQPNVGLWNLSRFAETLLPLLHEEEASAIEIATERLSAYAGMFQQNWIDGMRSKIGLKDRKDTDKDLSDDLLKIMSTNEADFTLTFRKLSALNTQADEADEALLELFNTTAAMKAWLQRWRERLQQENSIAESRQVAMINVNPLYIPRNHQVEAAIRAAEDNADFAQFNRLHEILQHPYQEQPGCSSYALPPRPEEIVNQTFCGT